MSASRTFVGACGRLSRGRIAVSLLLLLDALAIVPSVMGAVMSAFLWDDPHADKIALRETATLLLLAAPLLIGASALLLGARLVRRRRPGALGLLSVLPACAILVFPAWFAVDDLQDWRETRRLDRSYQAIVATPEMAGFRRLVAPLPAWERLHLAEQARDALRQRGETPPETLDALYAAQYRLMRARRDALRQHSLTRAQFDALNGIDWAVYHGVRSSLGESARFPFSMFLALGEPA